MPDRTIAPPFVKSSSFNLIRPQEKKLSNGVDLFLVPGGSQDVLKIDLVFPAGRWFEPKPATAYFTAHMLSKGTRGKTSFEIASIFDRYGAHLEVNPGLDFVSLSLYTLSKNLGVVLELLCEILSSPVFPEKEFEQMRSVFLQSLKINNERTSYVASQTFRKRLFGEAYPYGVEVTAEHVQALQRNELAQYFADHFQTPMVFAAGKLDSGASAFIAETLSRLAVGKARPTPRHVANAKPASIHLERKDAVQSSIRMGGKSVLRSNPDYVSVLFATHILGGYFGSRLMKNIREDKGLTYGISASVHALKADSYFVVGADVNKENVGLTFEEIRRELKRLRTTPVGIDELETSRNHFIGSLQAEITTPFAHADKLRTIALFRLPHTYYQDMITQIERITPEQILATSNRYLHEDLFFQVAVG